MNKIIVSIDDRNRVTFDRLIVNCIWQTKKLGNVKLYSANNKANIRLSNKRKVFVKREQGITVLRLEVPVNGHHFVRQHLHTTKGIDFSAFEATVKDQLNFIPIAVLSNPEIRWRGLLRKQLPEIIFNHIESIRLGTESLLKDELKDCEFNFKYYAIYSSEIALDIASPVGAELISLPQVRTVLAKYSVENFNSHFTETPGYRTLNDGILSTEEGIDNGKQVIRGKLYSGLVFQFYVKEKMKKGLSSQHVQLLNRLELKVNGPEQVRKITSNGKNTFKTLSELVKITEDCFNYWFNFLYRVLRVAYDSSDEKLIRSIMERYIAEAHPNRADLIIHDLFVIGKLDINAEYVIKSTIYKMAKDGLLYKPDNSPKGRRFYALDPNFKNKVINELKGNQHGFR